MKNHYKGIENTMDKSVAPKRILFAFVPLAYITSTLSTTVHEFGHAISSKLMGSTSNGIYIAPGVVGYASYHIKYGVSIDQRNFILISGPWAGMVFGIILFIIALLLARKTRHWIVGMLAIAGALSIADDASYLTVSPIIKWGDGYELLLNGVPGYVFVIFGIVMAALVFGVLAPISFKLLEGYYPTTSFKQIFLALILVLVIPQL
jgi:hypothetical protein